MTFQIISADARLAERRGAKVLLLGPSGVGKTFQLRTLDASRTLFLDVEAGDLSVQDVPVDSIRLSDWPTARDVICQISGPNPSYAPTAPYSHTHYETIGGALKNLDKYDTIFVDSVTAVSRLSFRHAEQQPEALSSSGKKDLRGTYGLHARELIAWLNHLQRARDMNVILVGVLECTIDDFHVPTWRLQCEGNKTSRELPGIVDEIITYQFLDFGDGKDLSRAFVCTSPNPWAFPAKDRSGRLEQIEPPDLGRLLHKLTNHIK